MAFTPNTPICISYEQGHSPRRKKKFRKLTLIHYTLPVLRPHSRCASCPNNVWKNPVLWVWYSHQSQCSVPRVTGKETSVLMPLSLGHWNTCRLEYALLLTPGEAGGWPWSSSWTGTSLIFPTSRRENKKEEVDSQVSILESRVTDLLVRLACIDGTDLDNGSLIMWNSSLGNCNCFLFPGEMYMVFRASTHLWFLFPSDVLDQNYVWAPRLNEFANLKFWWTILSLGTGDCPPVTSLPLQGAHQPAQRGSNWTC